MASAWVIIVSATIASGCRPCWRCTRQSFHGLSVTEVSPAPPNSPWWYPITSPNLPESSKLRKQHASDAGPKWLFSWKLALSKRRRGVGLTGDERVRAPSRQLGPARPVRRLYSPPPRPSPVDPADFIPVMISPGKWSLFLEVVKQKAWLPPSVWTGAGAAHVSAGNDWLSGVDKQPVKVIPCQSRLPFRLLRRTAPQ